jgi:threonine synthase
MASLTREQGWLGSPPGATWPSAETANENPFLQFRSLLWSYTKALDAGWSDQKFVATIQRLDQAVADIDGAGFRHTPLGLAPQLNESLGRTGSLWVKDETNNVSGSHKARHLFGLALHLAVDEVPLSTPLAIASCGNAALAAAVIARATGRPLAVHVPTWADPNVLDHLDDLGAQVRICERQPHEDGDPCVLRSREVVSQGAIAFGCQGTDNIFTLDGGRTLGFELAASWVEQQSVPDHLFIQVGGGALASSTVQALVDAKYFGALSTLPHLRAVQAAGCAPLNQAFQKVAASTVAEPLEAPQIMEPWPNPASAASGILDDVTYDWKPLVWALQQQNNQPVVAAEADIVEAHRLTHAHTAIDADPTGTAGLAGLLTAHADGTLDPSASAVVLFSGVTR